ncbi:farnesol dehydrogenase-like [Prorops nasuta]|uniref:farnesol dehydrogenase-like n=1 Tax=Prorops nasuta TaxID=863751 RepID=UPI0034CEC4CC
MERWIGKTALVTGASSGMGESACITLVNHGLKVIGLARRFDRMEKLAIKLERAKGRFYPMKCDVTKESEILEAFKFAETLGGIDILINNAGLFIPNHIIDGPTADFDQVLGVNLRAAAICIRETAQSVKKRKSQGHIINICSILGHNVEIAKGAPMNLYTPTKFALRAMSDVVRHELSVTKADIKLTNLSPGLVKTEMPGNSSYGEKIYEVMPYLLPKDVVDSMIFVLGTPPRVEITELTIQPFNGNLESNNSS